MKANKTLEKGTRIIIRNDNSVTVIEDVKEDGDYILRINFETEKEAIDYYESYN